jgi:hypothetical protein
MSKSIFHDEWRRCLQAHYADVVRRQDRVTERTLRPLLLRAGFREDDLRELYVTATMHVDAVPEDFVPDLSNVTQTATPKASMQAERTFSPHPAECTCPACMDIVDETRHDSQGQPISAEEAAENAARSQWAQKTLF